MRAAVGIGPDVAAEMLIVASDNLERIRSEAAFATLCGACPIPASSGVTHPASPIPRRPPAGERRPASRRDGAAPLARATMAYVARRAAEGLSKRDILRCLERFGAREIYRALLAGHRARAASALAA